MPKHGAMTAKAIGKRIKSKGLKKLRWYCQMCQKQCRDENGFKCHCMSEGHLRQMALVAENPNKFVDSFSKDFEDLFLELLARRYGEKRILANTVYQEYIADRDHVHMNATMWDSLSSFVKYLGRKGKCRVEESERGWYIQWIRLEADGGVSEKEADIRRKRARRSDEDRMSKILKRRMEESRIASNKVANHDDAQEKKRQKISVDSNMKVSVKLAISAGGDESTVKRKKRWDNLFSTGAFGASEFAEEAEAAPKSKELKISSSMREIRKDTEAVQKSSVPFGDSGASAVAGASGNKVVSMMKKDSHASKSDSNRRISGKREKHWISKNIVVRIVSETIESGSLFRKKGVVVDVKDLFEATVQLRKTDAKVRVLQKDLETVIPKAGEDVLIVNGRGRGCVATVTSRDKAKCIAMLRLETGEDEVRKRFDDICMLDCRHARRGA